MIRLPATVWAKYAAALSPPSLQTRTPLSVPSTQPMAVGNVPAVKQMGQRAAPQLPPTPAPQIASPGVPGVLGVSGPSHTNKLPGSARLMSVIQDMGPLSTVPGQVNGNAGQGVRTGVKAAAASRLLNVVLAARGRRS